MIRWLRGWWHGQQRDMDLKILWPACKEQAQTPEDAISIFMHHASTDPAWYLHYTPNQLETYLRSLL